MDIDSLLPKIYDYKESEGRIFKLWESHKAFDGNVDHSKKPFCVVIPPPNVTGILHMGHVLDNVPQDIMTRWHRMRGFAAVWIPGTDHAGIATQNVVEKQLAKEGKKARDLGREEFVKRVWEFKEKHGQIIIEQLKRLGCSCDWRRERFTMDDGLSRAVLKAFITYYERGLIYKGKRMINWCPRCRTALSDDEVNHENKKSSLWHLRYPLLDKKGAQTGEFIIVATTRPETMLGDTAVAVHPEDPRYSKVVGGQIHLPLQNRPIPIIADSFVDKTFGSGAVKVTPAHDPNDYQVALRHNLAFEVVIGEDGKMTKLAGQKYASLDRYEARKLVVADLESAGLMEKIEPHHHSVGQCYRCETVIEPSVSDQWFVKMRPLAEKSKQAVLDGRITIIPESERHDYFHWMDTIQDWCISRQLWWGHRIPIYYCGDCKNVMAAIEAPTACNKCSSKSLSQDPDVLDTWFSSQLWPYSTIGWPEQTEELKFWFPNTWLMSGRDILFFWDARMIMSALELTGEVPFRVLALHGIVRDSQGRKLSKSLGNSPDPLGLFDQYGTDAVRAGIISKYPMGRQDTRLNESIYREGQALITKLWNATRFLFMNLGTQKLSYDSRSLKLETLEDRWLVSRLARAIKAHDTHLEQSDITHALEAVWGFFWNEYCDWYIEIVKPRLQDTTSDRSTLLALAFHCHTAILKLFHPYIPFVTEELWQKILAGGVNDKAASEACIMKAAWPKGEDFAIDASAENSMSSAMSLVRGLREVRHNLNLSPKAKMVLQLSFANSAAEKLFKEYERIASDLGHIEKFLPFNTNALKGTVPFKFDGGIAYASVPSDVKLDDVRKQLTTKMENVEQQLTHVKKQLSDEGFVNKAKESLVLETRQKAVELEDALQKLRSFYDSIKQMG